ncbi:hypothetical protein HBH68_134490 [Parastagonospora nodorum]|nr:hypothetical protein HBH68_134490 [Parastagonospora nodorum]KAH5352593.1 hypothetical protein HBI48_148130 [Parastagonospora nodorum]
MLKYNKHSLSYRGYYYTLLTLQKRKIATLAQKKNLKNAYATSKYTNRQNKLIDKVYKYIASYNKLSSFNSNRKLLLTNLTPLKVSAY